MGSQDPHFKETWRKHAERSQGIRKRRVEKRARATLLCCTSSVPQGALWIRGGWEHSRGRSSNPFRYSERLARRGVLQDGGAEEEPASECEETDPLTGMGGLGARVCPRCKSGYL